MWIAVGAGTWNWHQIVIYNVRWTWFPACIIFVTGLFLYRQSFRNFSRSQLGGLPEIIRHNSKQPLVTAGIRSRIRHPVYLAHLCEMVAWSIGSGLAVTYGLTAFAIFTGAFMIRTEDKELEQRFGEAFRAYRQRVPSVLPVFHSKTVNLASRSSRSI